MKNQLRIGQTVRLTEDAILGTYSLGVVDSITTSEGYAVTEIDLEELWDTEGTVGIKPTKEIDYDHWVYGVTVKSIVS
tara:strand:- start:268 stop:501 length:234 start_codon:yes stop_codon:yes gene_type:complete